MEYEADARRLCSFDSHLTGEEIQLLKLYEKTRQETNAGDMVEQARMNVGEDGQSVLSTVSK